MAKDLFRGAQPCLTQAQLDSAAHGTADARILRHLDGCAHCQTELRLLHSFLTSEPTEDEQDIVQRIVTRLPVLPVAPQPWWQRWLIAPWSARAAAVAFASLAVVAVGISLSRRNPAPIDLTSLEGQGVVRGSAPSRLTPSGVLTALPSTLSWTADSRSSDYRVVVQFVDGTPVWEGRSGQPELRLPVPVREALAQNRPLRWKVVVLGPTGRVLDESGWIGVTYNPSNR